MKTTTKTSTLLLAGLMALTSNSFSQNIAINSTGAFPDTSAMLDVSSTVKGFLAPRMTTTEQNAIPLPATGLIVYNTTTKTLNVNVGTPAIPSWSSVSFGSAAGGSGWGLTGNSSTSSSNYIGTSDGQPLTFKVNNTKAGYLGLSGSSFATSFGVSSNAGYQSTAIGAAATASANNEATAVGYNAVAGGFRSIAIGSGAAASSSQNETVAIGYSTSVSSYRGIAIGYDATASTNNNAMAVGAEALASGFQSTAIGNNARATAQNSTAIGNGAAVSNANYIAIGNTSVTAIRGQVNFTTFSDGRFKRNIKADVPSLDFIMKLRPVTYNWDIHKFNAHARGKDHHAIPASYNGDDEEAIRKKESILYTGFIAQEVEKAAQDADFNFSGVLKPIDEKDAYSVSYAEFVVPLVKATQELNKKNEDLNNKLEAQQILINKLLEEVNGLKKNK
jgi:hypothetical protein